MNVLAVGCHPDDLEIGCGGTLAMYALQGHNVIMCHVANGDKGHAVILPEELRKIRAAEAHEAGKAIGAAEVINLDVPDLEVNSNDAGTVSKMVDAVRYIKPDVIITHNPEDYMKDHMEVSKLVFDASFSSSVPHYHSAAQPLSLKTIDTTAYPNIVPIYYMDTLAGINFLPVEYVDISSVIDKKITAVNCHKSQVKWMMDHDHIDFPDFVRTVSKFRGLQCGVAYAEGFKQCLSWPRLTIKRLLP